MKYRLIIEDENGKQIDFSADPNTTRLIAENIDSDTLYGVVQEYLPESISQRLMESIHAWEKYRETLRNLSESVSPRTVWINEKDRGGSAVLSEKNYTDKAKAEKHSEVLDDLYLRTVKFLEVVE